MRGTCGFCLETADLQNSHVLPAFVFRWLRRRGTGHIRASSNPNLRVQDGEKRRWLCKTCEQNFGRYESLFAEKLFRPWSNGQYTIQYEEWFLKFCVSVSWRVLTHCKGKNPDHRYTAAEDEAAEAAAQRWKAFLRDEVPHPGKFEQHVIPFDVVEETSDPDMPTNISRYLTGAIEMDIVGSSTNMMTYAKLGRFVIFGIVRPGQYKFEGTKVHVRSGTLRPGKFVLPGPLLGFFKGRARSVQAIYDSISPNQQAKIDANLLANIDNFTKSDQFRSLMADAEMFGRSAIIRKEVPNSG